MSPDICLIFPKVLDQLYKDITLTRNLLYVPSILKKRKQDIFLLIISICGKGLEVNIMVRSGNFRHVAQNSGLHSLGEASYRFSSQPRTPFPHSSKFKQRLPSLGQGTSCCLPAGKSGSSFDLLFFSQPRAI